MIKSMATKKENNLLSVHVRVEQGNISSFKRGSQWNRRSLSQVAENAEMVCLVRRNSVSPIRILLNVECPQAKVTEFLLGKLDELISDEQEESMELVL